MAKIDVLDILYAKKYNPLEFNFDALSIPPIWYYLTPSDIEQLRQIATSVKLSSKIQQKYKMIDSIMKPRGFKRFSAGTNRIVYNYLDDTRFLVKIAVDRVGMQDNPLEFKNQHLLKPFVTKMFYMSPCGTVAFVERVFPVKNREEFLEIADDVFDILVNKILGKYVVEDVGARYFMNWGIRLGMGPVLLDYPYIYKLDGSKLYCNKIMNAITKETCDGEIDYDCGFNHLVCLKCGKVYMASDLRDDTSVNKTIIIRGGSKPMKIAIKKGNKTIYEPIVEHNVMKRENPKYEPSTKLKVVIKNPATGSVYHCDTGEKVNVKESVKDRRPKYNLGVSVSGLVKKNETKKKEIEAEEPTMIEGSNEAESDVNENIEVAITEETASESEDIEIKMEVEDEFTPISNIVEDESVVDDDSDNDDEDVIDDDIEDNNIEESYENIQEFNKRDDFDRDNRDDYRKTKRDYRNERHQKKKNRVYSTGYEDMMD